MQETPSHSFQHANICKKTHTSTNVPHLCTGLVFFGLSTLDLNFLAFSYLNGGLVQNRGVYTITMSALSVSRASFRVRLIAAQTRVLRLDGASIKIIHPSSPECGGEEALSEAPPLGCLIPKLLLPRVVRKEMPRFLMHRLFLLPKILTAAPLRFGDSRMNHSSATKIRCEAARKSGVPYELPRINC